MELRFLVIIFTKIQPYFRIGSKDENRKTIDKNINVMISYSSKVITL